MDDKNNVCEKLKGFDFWQQELNRAELIVAPMVDQSELAWRLLSRRHGAQLCYTPMYHASVFVRDSNYRREALLSCEEDRPLIVQFCANNPETLLKAAKYTEGMCEAVDLNIGCPQAIAKRGHYGVFLQDEWQLLHNMVSLCAKQLSVPITCKIRVFDDVDRTVKYAQMLEKAGCQLLTVHGRTKEQKGAMTGVASWSHIKAVREAVNIPVFANGNIQFLQDVQRCISETGVHGVMTAEGNLHNPALFSGLSPPVWAMAEEYLTIVKQHPCPMSYIRGHIFKLFHHLLLVHTEVREVLGNSKNIQDVKEVIKLIKEKSQSDVEAYQADPEKYRLQHYSQLLLPYWMCQPYVRPTPEESEKRQLARQNTKRPLAEFVNGPDDKPISNNKLKKMRRNPTKVFTARPEKFVNCSRCSNPKGLKCNFDLCRCCCRKHAYEEMVDCPGHKILAKTQKELKQKWEERERKCDGTDQNSDVEKETVSSSNSNGQKLKEENLIGNIETPDIRHSVDSLKAVDSLDNS